MRRTNSRTGVSKTFPIAPTHETPYETTADNSQGASFDNESERWISGAVQWLRDDLAQEEALAEDLLYDR